MRTPCKVEGCATVSREQGFCVKHLRRFQAHGDPLVVKNGRGKPVLDRFMERIVKQDDGCWIWTRGTNDGGYGRFRPSRADTTYAAHRWAYMTLVGPIPEGMTIDHLCRVRLCCNPAHLEPVTMRTNVLRGNTITAAHAAKSHCPRGHSYDVIAANGSRACRQCRNAQAAASRARVKARRLSR